MRRTLLLVTLVALPWAGGCLDITGNLGAQRDQLLRKVEDVRKQVRAKSDKFNQRDMLRSELNAVMSEIEEIKSMVGQGSGAAR